MAKKNGLEGLPSGISNATKTINEVKRSAGSIKRTVEDVKRSSNVGGKNDGAEKKLLNQEKDISWVCECGITNKTKFCGGCGKPAPVEMKMICPKCKWERPLENSTMKFCGNCGAQLEAAAETKGGVATGTKPPKQQAAVLRVLAVCMWVLAITAEVMAILILNKWIYTGDSFTTWLILALAVDLIFVVIGSQCWKKSNHIDPASGKDKIKFWLWNNLGVIVSVIAFFPIIILTLNDKKMDKKAKKIVTVVGAVALLIAGVTSYEWNPVSLEDAFPAVNAQETSIGSEVYWTRFGKKYHLYQDCSSLTRSNTLFTGTVNDAYEAKRLELCTFCANAPQRSKKS
jgi:hypothetical protein